MPKLTPTQASNALADYLRHRLAEIDKFIPSDASSERSKQAALAELRRDLAAVEAEESL